MLGSKPIIDALLSFSSKYNEIYPKSAGSSSLKEKYATAQAHYLTGRYISVSTKPFHVLNHDYIQADTGGNAFFAPEKIDAVLKKLELEDFSGYQHYQPEAELARNIQRLYEYLDYIPKGYRIDVTMTPSTASSSSSESTPYVMTYGHGTTQIFEKILENIIKNKHDIIIVPTPTYGLFIPLMQKFAKIKTFDFKSHLGTESDEFNVEKLRKFIQSLEKENLHKYKKELKLRKTLSESHYGHRKVKKEIRKLLKIIKKTIKHKAGYTHYDLDEAVSKYNRKLKKYKKKKFIKKLTYEHLILAPLPRVRALYSINPMMPSGKILTQPMIDSMADVLKEFPDLLVIEDAIHRGILLQPEKKIGTFTKTPVVSNTLIIDGISKIFDLARARAAFAIGDRKYLKPIAHSLHISNCTLNATSVAFLEAIYKLTNKQFLDHLEDISQAYRHRLNIVKAMVYGIQALPVEEQARIRRKVLKEHSKKIPVETMATLFEGIDGLKFYSDPEAGYFLLLDFSAFLGKCIGDIRMLSGMDFRNAFYNLADVNTIPDVMCYDLLSEDQAYLRFSISVDHEIDMIEALLRIKKVLSCCTDEPLTSVLANAQSESLAVQSGPLVLSQRPKRGRPRKVEMNPSSKTQRAQNDGVKTCSKPSEIRRSSRIGIAPRRDYSDFALKSRVL